MTAYIVDNHNFKIAEKYPDATFASFAMSDNYGWEPDNRYSMIHNEDALFEYWELHGYESGEFYEGTGISENIKHEMFKEWMEE
jgi:hypothetical protein